MRDEPVPGFRWHRDAASGEEWLEVPIKGELLNDFPMFNKGTGFTQEERDELGLTGVMPPRVVSMELQAERVLLNYRRQATDIDRYLSLMALLDRNETLFYRVLIDHLEELLPIVYTPTVGLACQQFGRIYRRTRGIYLRPEDAGRVDEILATWPFPDVRVIVVTDGERVLGLGDLGAGGMGISIGKSSLYVAGAGIHPARVLPVCLDVGTNNENLLLDALYLGKARRRVRGPEYDQLVDAFFQAVARRWPRAMVQFEDFGMGNALRLLERWRDRACCFNDDIQGTGAVALAAVLAGLRVTGGRLEEQRVVIAGAGSAGTGIARSLSGAQIWMADVDGLVTASRAGLTPEQKRFARDEPAGTLAETVARVKPTVLVGVTGKANVFTREMVQAMAGPRPIVLPLSNPTAMCECLPDDVRAWTGSKAIVATGSPLPGTPQCNNVYIFPGVGLGVVASEARRVTDGMMRAAAHRLASMSQGEQLFPAMHEIRKVSAHIAYAVAKQAMEEGVAAKLTDDALRARIADEIWEPRYIRYRPSPTAMTREDLLRAARR
jgi:malate dehydrogenase (oxaloacetate-decarboxylating)